MDQLFYTQLAGNKPYLNIKLAAVIVNCRRGCATGTFEQMNKYFMMTNLPFLLSTGMKGMALYRLFMDLYHGCFEG